MPWGATALPILGIIANGGLMSLKQGTLEKLLLRRVIYPSNDDHLRSPLPFPLLPRFEELLDVSLLNRSALLGDGLDMS